MPSQADRIADLEVRVQNLELQVAILQGKVIVQDGQYQVRPGDTAAKIAFMFGVNLSDLMAFNPGQAWAKLKVGQLVRIAPKTAPNQSPEPVLSSGASPAVQEPRHP
jgi:LysM repeat protein